MCIRDSNGATFVSVQGGDAGTAGFMMQGSAGAGLVIGFMNPGTGLAIPAGSGVLTTLTITGDASAASLSNVTISNQTGSATYAASDITVSGLSITIDAADDVVSGCTDDTACNYNDQATLDDGSCTYPQTNYDCDGNCIVDFDCDGACGGDALVDD